ncbi:hypothetical protein EJB05_24152, partial [Eragrostis curvula]
MEAKKERTPSTPPSPASMSPTEDKVEESEGKRLNSPAAAAAGMEATSAAVLLVLSDGYLLREILLRLDFPTCLVRAAAVSKQWLRVASDPAFLRRFRDLHPPRLLGFYLNTSSFRRLEFVPMLPQPPELAAVLRRGRFSLDAYENSFSSSLDADDDEGGSSKRGINGMDCRNGRLFFGLYCDGTFTYGVHSPLHPARGVATVPQVPCHIEPDRRNGVVRHVLSRQVGDGLSYFWFSFLCTERGKATAHFYTLQDGASWHMNTRVKLKIPGWSQSKQALRSFLSVDDKIFVVATVKYVLVFDSTSSTFSTINFPDEMVFDGVEILLSQSNDAGFYLVHLKGLELSIWLYREINGSMGNWLLLDSICLRGMCADLQNSDCEAEDGSIVHLAAVGDNAEFVFLNTDACVFYLDFRSRLLHKVYEITETDEEEGAQHEPKDA